MTLVSRRWRHLWEHLQVFDFDEDSFDTVQESKRFKKFALFVNAVLAFRKSRDIRNFQLTCDIQSSNHRCDCADMWIRAAINPSLEELSLSIVADYRFDKDVVLPRSLLNCTNLVSLCLVGGIRINLQYFELHFPSLKFLKLDADIVDSEIDLLSACPVLETLHHIYFVSEYWTIVPVPPSSQRLKFTGGSFSWTFLQVGKTTLGIIGNLQSMVEACIDFFPSQKCEFVDPILDCLLVDDPSEIQLRHSTSKWSLRSRILNHPEFCYLLHLKFILPCFNTNLIVNVLEKCHMIEVFIIQCNKEEQPPLRTWDPESTTVPKCLKSHLSYIHIEGYQGFEDDLTFAEYILRNGLVLKTMLIFVDTSMDQTIKYYSVKRLTDIPRGSNMCQLKFDPTVSS
ncbi:F-box/FBD/LRR-repeat protein At5g53840-like [Vicia villosa]|uniref:F-box/FBD/LRR-repeat protein At5g53840-like n=1 Tax=Vicia villosa TaxID=3911 RepID=UPI00273B2F05|nr:F-box/FBD/LRR-repeat protein At5g53840-like [Vicia villosa]